MKADKIKRLEKLLERKLSPEEKERLRKIGHVLGIHADDALWDVLAAMEYQKTYYEALPEKIATASKEILQNISSAAEAEARQVQGRLAEGVAELAQKLAVRVNLSTLLPMGLCALISLLIYGSLAMWAGFRLGAGQSASDQTISGIEEVMLQILHMPSGILMGIIALAGGLYLGVHAAREFAEGKRTQRKELLVTLLLWVAGSMLTAFTV